MGDTIVWLFVAIIIVGGGFLALMMLTRKPSKYLDQQKYRERWLSINGAITNDSGSQELAIINADKLLDQALRERGVSGETMGERMKTAKAMFSDNNAVWNAHKLRNRIAHENTVKLNPLVTKRAMSAFKTALKDVGAL